MRRGKECLASEERHAHADAGDRAVGQDAEHLVRPQRPHDAEGGVRADELQAHPSARAIHGALHVGVLGLDGQHRLVAMRHEDLANERDRTEMRGRDDNPPAAFVGAHEVVPSPVLDRGDEPLGGDARDLEDLEVIPRLLDEHAAHR